jgi:hypothetical protein
VIQGLILAKFKAQPCKRLIQQNPLHLMKSQWIQSRLVGQMLILKKNII